MHHTRRKIAPRVRGGAVLRKNRTAETAAHQIRLDTEIVVDRKRPGRNYVHVMRRQDVRRFMELIPRWQDIQRGLHTIMLDEGHHRLLGWYAYSGVIGLCAFPRDLTLCSSERFIREMQRFYDRLGVTCEEDEDDWFRCVFTRSQARALMLLHVLLHEIGHHVDRTSTRTQASSARGEPYANSYSFERAEVMWEDYERTFGPI